MSLLDQQLLALGHAGQLGPQSMYGQQQANLMAAQQSGFQSLLARAGCGAAGRIWEPSTIEKMEMDVKDWLSDWDQETES